MDGNYTVLIPQQNVVTPVLTTAQESLLQLQQQYSQYQQPKLKGINLYSIPLFNIYNPKNAMVNFSINTQTNDLTIVMTPAIPNNPAMNIRGPVPEGTKVYDHSKKVNSVINYVELIDLVDFLRRKCFKDNDNLIKIVNDLNLSINEIKNNVSVLLQYQQNNPQIFDILQNINNKLNIIQNQNNQILNKSNNVAPQNNINNQFNKENAFSMYRSANGGSKSWSFIYDSQYDKIHINVTVKNNMSSNKISTSISIDMAKKLLTALESYMNNFSTNSMITNLSMQLSETLANNQIFAPNKK